MEGSAMTMCSFSQHCWGSWLCSCQSKVSKLGLWVELFIAHLLYDLKKKWTEIPLFFKSDLYTSYKSLLHSLSMLTRAMKWEKKKLRVWTTAGGPAAAAWAVEYTTGPREFELFSGQKRSRCWFTDYLRLEQVNLVMPTLGGSKWNRVI